jgi:hypothetical protein
MIRVCRQLAFEDGARLQQIGIGAIGRQRRLIECQRVEDARLRILLVGIRQFLHRLLIGNGPGARVHVRGVLVEQRHSLDVVALPLRLGRRSTPFVYGCLPERDRLHASEATERVPPPAHRDAPTRHRAVGILRQHLFERIDGGREPERMEQRDAAIEVGRDVCRARRRKVNVAEALRYTGWLVLVLSAYVQRPSEHQGDAEQCCKCFHGSLPVTAIVRSARRIRR